MTRYSPFALPLILTVVLAASACPTASAQTVLYRETYGRPDAAGNQALINWDWARFNALGAVGSLTNGDSGDGDGGKPIDVANTASAGPNADLTTDPYAEGWAYMDGTLKLAMTTEYSFDPAAVGPITFSWYQGANYDAGVTPGLNEARVALRIGTQWYVSNTFKTNTPVTSGANFGSTDPNVAQGGELQTLAYDPAAANWLTLAFDGDWDSVNNTATASTVAPAIGAAPASPLSGTITAFGLYRDGVPTAGNFNFRWDTFTITGGAGGGFNVADFNHVNGVNGADLTVLTTNFGTGTTNAQGNADGDTDVDGNDFLIWQRNVGNTSASAAAGVVPEPAALGLLIVASAGVVSIRRNGQRLAV